MRRKCIYLWYTVKNIYYLYRIHCTLRTTPTPYARTPLYVHIPLTYSVMCVTLSPFNNSQFSSNWQVNITNQSAPRNIYNVTGCTKSNTTESCNRTTGSGHRYTHTAPQAVTSIEIADKYTRTDPRWLAWTANKRIAWIIDKTNV